MSELKPRQFVGAEMCDKAIAVFNETIDNELFERLAAMRGYVKERTCRPIQEVLDSVDTGVGLLDRFVDNCSECGEPLTADYSANAMWRRVLPNHCPHCGAKVVNK